MSPDVLILIATAILASVALIAAVISVRNLNEIRRSITQPSTTDSSVPAVETPTEHPVEKPVRKAELLEPIWSESSASTGEIVQSVSSAPPSGDLVPHHGQIARVVDGHVVVTPTRAQVATAIMGQPRVRFAIWATGIAHALRPESRDRIAGLMRRDYRERRRHREHVAREAIRTAHSPATRTDEQAR